MTTGLSAAAAVLAMATPRIALAQTCTPPPTQGPAAAPAPIGPASQFCTGSYATGIGYTETTTGGNLSVTLAGPGTVNGVVLNDSGGATAANLTLVLGNATSGAQNITGAGNAVTITSSGGNVVIATGNSTIPGETITGNVGGIDVSTTGNGTVNVSTVANVTGLASNGIRTHTVNGSNTVNVGGNVVAAAGSGVRAYSTGSGAV
ncbi:MAG TPA: hypothetical protein VHZ26_04005, partial [Caulobacteraceae bacterium]|nr:hypothetical protein [Caulobacteraceae bacterium]